MSKIRTGGPAFPLSDSTITDYQNYNDKGMTLRDWFAGQALAGVMASDYDPQTWERYATVAYQVADAMIVERAKGGDT